jgi:hypothetical protein
MNIPATLDEDASVQLSIAIGGLNASYFSGELTLFDTSADSIRDIVSLCKDVEMEVRLNAEGWRDRHVAILAGLSHARKLTIALADKLTDESIFHISRMSSLQVLDLGSVIESRFTPAALRKLSQLPRLELLKLPHKIATIYSDGSQWERYQTRPEWPEVAALVQHFRKSRPDVIIPVQ